MSHEKVDSMYRLCQKHMKQRVLIDSIHGERFEGVIIDVDETNVYLVVSSDYTMPQMERQFGYGYGFGPYGYGYPGFGYAPRPRLSRLVLPLTFIAALSLLPW